MPSPEPSRNVELKARLSGLASSRQTALGLGATSGGIEHQCDTYFHVPNGRLKLREIDGKQAVLIAYSRPNTKDSRRSDYMLVPVSDPAILKQALANTLGVRATVAKSREIFFYRNVRIHLDQVDGLGTFLEFEAVLGPDETEEAGHALVEQLRREFKVREEDLLKGSYGEMIG